LGATAPEGAIDALTLYENSVLFLLLCASAAKQSATAALQQASCQLALQGSALGRF
jgi:hypothetical protein